MGNKQPVKPKKTKEHKVQNPQPQPTKKENRFHRKEKSTHKK